MGYLSLCTLANHSITALCSLFAPHLSINATSQFIFCMRVSR